MKYFKVLGPNLTSFNQQCLDMPNSLQYKEHEWIFAPSGRPLFIFDTLEHAQDFIKSYTDCSPRIFECEIEGLVHKPVDSYLSKEGRWPPGTLFAYGVKITNEVMITNEVILNKKLENLDIVVCCNMTQYVQLDKDYVVIRNKNGLEQDRKLHKNIVWRDATHFQFSDGVARYEWTGRKAKLVMELADDN